MRHREAPGLAGAILFLATFAHGATITGTVKASDGTPFERRLRAGAEHQDAHDLHGRV